MTSMLWMSSGLRSPSRLASWPPPACRALIDVLGVSHELRKFPAGPEAIRTPSTYTTGFVALVSDPTPRMRMVPAVPTVPLLCSTVTPGARAPSSSATFVVVVFSDSAAALTVVIALPSVRFDVAEGTPVTTTSSSEIATCVSEKSATVVPPALTSTSRVAGAKPISFARSTR